MLRMKERTGSGRLKARDFRSQNSDINGLTRSSLLPMAIEPSDRRLLIHCARNPGHAHAACCVEGG